LLIDYSNLLLYSSIALTSC